MDSTIRKSRYFKQILLPEIGETGQKRLSESSVLIVGCGALGSVIANSLVRAGVGRVRIIDRDFIELDNLPRQILFDEEDVRKGLPKAIAAAEKLRLINSEITIEPVVEDLTAQNIESLLKGIDLVIDGTDNFETRFLINEASVKFSVPWIYGGVVSTYGMSFTIIPGETPCFQCFVNEMPQPGSSPTCDTVGVLGTAVSIVASIEVTEAIKFLTGKKEALLRKLVYIDAWNSVWNLFNLTKGKTACSVCDEKKFVFLEKRQGTRATSLCGQNAIQIYSPVHTISSFEELARRLASAGEVRYNEYMLKFNVDIYEFTIFTDGRTIIKGTTDESNAKTLFSKYIGV
jgi:molybdopterin-synthase adenylyltransferase